MTTMTLEQVRDYLRFRSRYVAKDRHPEHTMLRCVEALTAHLAQPAQAVDAWLILTEEGDPSMLFFDRDEALHYCDEGEEPIPLTRALSVQKAGPVGEWVVEKRRREKAEAMLRECVENREGLAYETDLLTRITAHLGAEQ